MLPPEVTTQVEEIYNVQAAKPMPARPTLQRSSTSLNVNEPGAMPTGAPSDIQLQKRCAALEGMLDKWVSIAQLLASELAYREKRLWEWQMDNTNTKAILQKFKDRLKKPGGTKGGNGGGSGPAGALLGLPGAPPRAGRQQQQQQQHGRGSIGVEHWTFDRAAIWGSGGRESSRGGAASRRQRQH